VFIRDVTAEAIRSWGTDDERVQKNIAIAVRRAVREGLERGNERANAINNINMACDDVLAVFTGLTRENYHEKMETYIRMVTTKPELVSYYTANSTPLPTGPVPSALIREALNNHYSKPANASARPADLDTMGRAELEALATTLGVMPSDRFDSFEHACKMSTMYSQNILALRSEVAHLKAKIHTATQEVAKQEQYWAYWSDKYVGETFEVAGVTITSRPALPDATLRAGSNDALRNIIRRREEAIRREISSGRHSKSTVRKLENEITVLRYDMDIIDGKIPDTPKTRYFNGKSYDTRRPSNIHATITAQNTIISDATTDINAWNAYRESMGSIAPKNDAMLLMSCCSILYDLNLNKLGGEIITANEVLERIGYDKVAGGSKYDPEYQKLTLSILNNLCYLNEEQRVNSPTYPEGGRIHQTTEMFQHLVYQI
jgi:hypothetical protein